MRNRLIAALGQGTVVIEAGRRSGSLNTAGHAATLGRPVGAVPGPVTSAASAGCHRLLREYDALCVTCADDVREMLGWAGGETTLSLVPEEHTGAATRVLDALSIRSWRNTDDVAARSGMAPDEVQTVLGLLGLEGRAEYGTAGGSGGSGAWRLVSR